jgi:hypothetical protein
MRTKILISIDYSMITSKLFLIFCVVIPSIVSCEKLNEREKVEEVLLGTWTWTRSSTSTNLWVDGDVLFHFLIVNQGFTTDEADLLEDDLLSNLDPTSGSITFYKDYTYNSSIDGMEPFDGTWSVTNNEDTIIYDQGTIHELQMLILGIYPDELDLLYPPESFHVDLDGDQVNDITVTAITVVRHSKSLTTYSIRVSLN